MTVCCTSLHCRSPTPSRAHTHQMQHPMHDHTTPSIWSNSSHTHTHTHTYSTSNCRESFGAGSVMTRIDLLTHIKTSMSPQLVSELQAIETIFLVLTRTTSFSGSSSSSISSPLGGSSFSAPVSVPFGRIQAAYQRAGELNLSYDKAHRISRCSKSGKK